MWCNYCKKGGHTIDVCRKRIYNEQIRANVNVVTSGQQGSGQQGSGQQSSGQQSSFNQNRRCYNCNEYAGHIARDCPRRNFQ